MPQFNATWQRLCPLREWRSGKVEVEMKPFPQNADLSKSSAWIAPDSSDFVTKELSQEQTHYALTKTKGIYPPRLPFKTLHLTTLSFLSTGDSIPYPLIVSAFHGAVFSF